jgi:hypothetical protein
MFNINIKTTSTKIHFGVWRTFPGRISHCKLSKMVKRFFIIKLSITFSLHDIESSCSPNSWDGIKKTAQSFYEGIK